MVVVADHNDDEFISLELRLVVALMPIDVSAGFLTSPFSSFHVFYIQLYSLFRWIARRFDPTLDLAGIGGKLTNKHLDMIHPWIRLKKCMFFLHMPSIYASHKKSVLCKGLVCFRV